MGIKVNLEQLEAQADSVSSSVDDIKNQLSNVQHQVQAFNDGNMSGAAIESAVSFISSTVVPIIVCTSDSLNTVAENSKKLVDSYISSVDTKSWSEDELQEKIDQLDQKIQANEQKIQDIKNKNQAKSDDEHFHKISSAPLVAVSAILEQQKQHYEEILEHLRTYAGESASLVKEINDTMLNGISAISSGYQGGRGANTFKEPDEFSLKEYIMGAVKQTLSEDAVEMIDKLGLSSRELAMYIALDRKERKAFKDKFKAKTDKIKEEIKKSKKYKNRIESKKALREKEDHLKMKDAEKEIHSKKRKLEKDKNRTKSMKKRGEKTGFPTRVSKNKYKKFFDKTNKQLKKIHMSEKATEYGKKLNKAANKLNNMTVVKKLNKVNRFLDGFESHNDVQKRKKAGMSYTASVGIELGSKAVGAAAGVAAGSIVGMIPVVGPIAAPIANSCASAIAEDLTEKQLTKWAKKGAKK